MHNKLGLFIFGLIISFQAVAFDGFTFQHKDWYLACDNSGTCRAAGYSDYNEYENPVAVLFERKAGPASEVTAKVFYGERSVNFGGSYESEATITEEERSIYHLFIDGKDFGAVKTYLNSNQVNNILSVVTRNTKITFGKKDGFWALSDSGASAVFRKMDEFQGRIGTQHAIVAKGNKSESQVYPAKAIPIIYNKAAKGEMQAVEHDSVLFKALFPLLVNDSKAQANCSAFDNDDFASDTRMVKANLGNGRSIVSLPCWMAAYNFADAFWIINDVEPYEPEFIRTGGYYSNGEISASYKGRGIGDCWSSESWVYYGEAFRLASSGDTGLCRAIAAGGIDVMPTFVSDVRVGE